MSPFSYLSPTALAGKKGLIVGIANNRSLAFGCAEATAAAGAKLAITYLNDKAKPFVEPLAQRVHAPLFLPLNVQDEPQMDAVFAAITAEWGKLDFLIHSIAFAPLADLQGRVVDCSLQGFLTAMDVSCHSFIRLAKRAEPLMKTGGSLLTMTYYGSEKVVEHYNMMGPVKAALEATTRYLASDLGHQGIRVNAISPGPVATRAASGIAHFNELLTQAAEKAPLGHLVTQRDVGNLAAFLVSDAACNITATIHYIDAGYQVVD
jgi:enoyl-[acyl-carrier protein] reductase I